MLDQLKLIVRSLLVRTFSLHWHTPRLVQLNRRRTRPARHMIQFCLLENTKDALEALAEEPWVRTLLQLGQFGLFSNLLATRLIASDLILEVIFGLSLA